MRTMLLVVLLICAVMHWTRADDGIGQLPKDAPSPLMAPFGEEKAKAAQQAWAKHLGKSSPVETNSIGMELVFIPPGEFRMGSPIEAQVEVKLTNGFYLGKTEVTQGQWQAVMRMAPWDGKERYVRRGANFPATHVNWDDANAFCKKLSESEKGMYRLPTEAEWEYACRGGTTTRFSFGDDDSELGEFAWYDKNAWDIGEQYAHEAGRKQPNPFGLHDMHGNVFEWCEDLYVDGLPGGTDPLAHTGGRYRVFRGGDWRDNAAFCRSTYRYRDYPSGRGFSVGFRIARSSGGQPAN